MKIINTITCTSEAEFREKILHYKEEKLEDGMKRMLLTDSSEHLDYIGVAFYYYSDKDVSTERKLQILLPVKLLFDIPKFITIHNKFNNDLDEFFRSYER